MASVPDCTPEGYAFQRDGGSGRAFAFVRRITQSLRRMAGRSQPAPPAPKSLVYALCEEYRYFELWAAYHAFRLDPHARNWQRLRRRTVPWQSELTVEELVCRFYPWNGKGTPDANAVGLALVTAAAVPASKNKR